MVIKSIIVAVSLNISIASAADNFENPLASELLKGLSTSVEGPLVLKNSLPKDDRVLFDNKYFQLSYPKCYSVEQFISDEDLPLSETAYVKIVKGKKCAEGVSDLKEFALEYHRSVERKIDVYRRNEKNQFMQKNYLIDGNEASVVGYIDDKYGVNITVINWIFKIYCPNAKYNVLEARAESHRGKEVTEYFKKKNFKVPPNFEQIVSTIRCK